MRSRIDDVGILDDAGDERVVVAAAGTAELLHTIQRHSINAALIDTIARGMLQQHQRWLIALRINADFT
jgi:hypothetical protein